MRLITSLFTAALFSAAQFVDFDRPGYAKTVARLDAIDLGNGIERRVQGRARGR